MTAGKWWQLEIAKGDQLCNTYSYSDAVKNDGDLISESVHQYQQNYFNNLSKSHLSIEKSLTYTTSRRGLITWKS